MPGVADSKRRWYNVFWALGTTWRDRGGSTVTREGMGRRIWSLLPIAVQSTPKAGVCRSPSRGRRQRPRRRREGMRCWWSFDLA
jgi:hypothetical protein